MIKSCSARPGPVLFRAHALQLRTPRLGRLFFPFAFSVRCCRMNPFSSPTTSLPQHNCMRAYDSAAGEVMHPLSSLQLFVDNFQGQVLAGRKFE